MREQNFHADALANISSSIKYSHKQNILIELLSKRSIAIEEEPHVLNVNQGSNSWIKPILKYIHNGIFPIDKSEARKIG